MKRNLFLLAFLKSLIVFSQTPCVNGFAGPYPCDGYDLQAHFDLSVFGADRGNDSWGWTDPDTGVEYAIMCLGDSTAFIDISDPVNPVYLGKLPTHTSNSTWRDAKVYNNHVFIVSEARDHGMQVFDLTRLRNVSNPPQIFTHDAHYSGFGSAHNIVINEQNGFAYAVGTREAFSAAQTPPQLYNGGPYIVNIQDPLNPFFVNGYSFVDYTHDAQVVFYSGPDQDHVGKEIYIGSNENEVVILDVTNKNNIQLISTAQYSNVAYSHQGWLTEDHRYFLMGDELDELNFGFNTRTVVFDFTDLDNPFQSFDYIGPTPAIDHNGYVRGDKFYLSNYTAGLRVIDISGIDNQVMTEVGFFDTYPQNDDVSFNGAWSVYPFFQSGNIVISDINRGFFLVKDPNYMSTESFSKNEFTLFPNPVKDYLTIQSSENTIDSILVLNTLGQEILYFDGRNTLSRTIDVSHLSNGMYYVVLNGNTSKKFIKK